jgi:hypothetical protein
MLTSVLVRWFTTTLHFLDCQNAAIAIATNTSYIGMEKLP